MTTPDRAAAPAPLAERLRALIAKATPGPWNSRGMGGHSEITTTAEPERNDTRIPRYAYGDEEKYSLAYPFLQDRREGGFDVRLDFVCFSHGDAALIATLVNNLPTLLAALDGREAWNEAIEAAAKLVAAGRHRSQTRRSIDMGVPDDEKLDMYRVALGRAWRDMSEMEAAIRALARPQPAGEAGDV